MNLHTVFLRDNCVLPESVDVKQHAFAKRWTQVDGLLSPDLDGIIRHAGWHYIWLKGGNSSRSWARTSEAAIDKALTHALSAVVHESNAAEVDSIKVAKFAGFWMANVSLQRRKIQQSTLLEAAERQLHVYHAR